MEVVVEAMRKEGYASANKALLFSSQSAPRGGAEVVGLVLPNRAPVSSHLVEGGRALQDRELARTYCLAAKGSRVAVPLEVRAHGKFVEGVWGKRQTADLRLESPHPRIYWSRLLKQTEGHEKERSAKRAARS